MPTAVVRPLSEMTEDALLAVDPREMILVGSDRGRLLAGRILGSQERIVNDPWIAFDSWYVASPVAAVALESFIRGEKTGAPRPLTGTTVVVQSGEDGAVYVGEDFRRDEAIRVPPGGHAIVSLSEDAATIRVRGEMSREDALAAFAEYRAHHGLPAPG